MIKINIIKPIFITSLLSIHLYADYSLLAPSVPAPLMQLNLYVGTRSSQVQAKLKSMENGVIQDIQEEVEKKEYNNTRLRKLSKLDYITNEEYLFLLKKINQLTSNSIDSENATTTSKKIIPKQ